MSNLRESVTAGHISVQFQNFTKHPMVILARYTCHGQMGVFIYHWNSEILGDIYNHMNTSTVLLKDNSV